MSATLLRMAALLPLAACAVTDPLERPGMWHPVGANDANLRAMVANPPDLVAGRGTQLADGAVVADAVARYRAGRVRKLPDASVSKIAPLAVVGGPAAGAGEN